jgi:hypothetical protein
MKVRELIKKLNKLPQDMLINTCKPINDIIDNDIIKTEIKTEIKTVTNNNTFIFDIGMMCDFIKMDRFEFLQKYFYITGLQYDITKDLFYSDRYRYLQEYYDKMIQIDINKALWQTQLLEYEIKQIQEKRGVK